MASDNTTTFSKPTAFFPSILLAAAIMVATLSGNDKAPFFVLGVVVINTLIFLKYMTAFHRLRTDKNHRLYCLFAALPLIYMVGVVVLSRHGLIDSLYFIGFR
ncbi:MAG: hypothetical protein AAB276_07820 [Pseudomonadota bacterium]